MPDIKVVNGTLLCIGVVYAAELLAMDRVNEEDVAEG